MGAATEKPDFICIGLPKAGTSTLHFVLDQHPDVAMPPVKELKFFNQEHLQLAPSRALTFFSRDWPGQQDRAYLYRFLKAALSGQSDGYQLRSTLRYFLGLRTNDAWYRGLFHRTKLSGDITVNYFMLTDQEIESVKQRYPNLKVIIMLRSPARLHWSYFRMVGLRKGEDDVFSEDRFLSEIEDKKRNIGRYRDLVLRWQRVFGAENTHVGYFEELQSDPVAFFTGICGFLGISGPDQWTAEQSKSINAVVNKSPEQDVPEFHARNMIDLCLLNLDGFSEVDEARNALWHADLEDLRRAAG